MSGLVYTGELRRTADGYEGFIADAWDWRLILKATVADEGGVKFFVLEGTPGPVPDGLLLPGETRKDGSVVA